MERSEQQGYLLAIIAAHGLGQVGDGLQNGFVFFVVRAARNKVRYRRSRQRIFPGKARFGRDRIGKMPGYRRYPAPVIGIGNLATQGFFGSLDCFGRTARQIAKIDPDHGRMRTRHRIHIRAGGLILPAVAVLHSVLVAEKNMFSG